MMSRRIESRIDKAKYGPSLNEVVIGAILSLVLGAVLAAVYLAMTPVKVLRELPMTPEDNTVYYAEGSRSAERGKQWMRKRQLFTEGSSVSLNEDELNAWISAGTAPEPPSAKPAAGSKATQAPAPPPSELLQMEVPNFRVRNGVMQVGCRVTVNLELVGLRIPLIAQTTGRFEKRDGGFSFATDRFYVGSFPLHKFFRVDRFLLGYLLTKVEVPDDISAAWKKLANVTVEGNSLKLTMP